MRKIRLVVLFLITGLTAVMAEPEKKPRLVSGGIALQANCSNWVLHNIASLGSGTFESLPNGGCDFSLFIDFSLHKNISLQCNLNSVFEWQNMWHDGTTLIHVFDYNLQPQVMAVGKIYLPKGHLRLGAGLGMSFVLASWTSDDNRNLYKQVVWTDPETGAEFTALHSPYISACATVGYEFDFGLQINACYQISCQNILLDLIKNAWVRPQKFSFGIAYRFR